MKPLMKKLVLTMAAVSLLILGGCSSNDQKNDKKGSDSETKKEEVKLIKNDRYVEPLNPSEQQIKAFNSLSAAVEKNPDHAISEEEAKQVAVNFVYDFFTLANKKSRSDIGGLQYLPSDSIREYIEFAEAYYYCNYPTIVNEYGKDALPQVSAVKVESSEEAQFVYNDTTCDGFTFKVSVSYAKTDLKESALKKEMRIKVMKIMDYDFNRSYDYTKRNLVFEGEMKSVYRVLAVE